MQNEKNPSFVPHGETSLPAPALPVRHGEKTHPRRRFSKQDIACQVKLVYSVYFEHRAGFQEKGLPGHDEEIS